MLAVRDYRRSLERSKIARRTIVRPTAFDMRGRDWDVLPGVFSPICSPTTALVLDLLDLGGPRAVPRTGSFLEIGCGAGLVAVSGALAGCERVVATDVNPDAAANTELNAARHGVGDRTRVVCGDLFDPLDPAERFDTIFWSSNYVLAPEDYEYRSTHERAYVDAGYRTHRRFLAEVVDRLTPTGSALLHFSSRGDLPRLLRLAGEFDLGLRARRGVTVQEAGLPVDHLLVEITRSTSHR